MRSAIIPWTMHDVARLEIFLILRLLENQISGNVSAL